jgi:hypothetical protein
MFPPQFAVLPFLTTAQTHAHHPDLGLPLVLTPSDDTQLYHPSFAAYQEINPRRTTTFTEHILQQDHDYGLSRLAASISPLKVFYTKIISVIK